MIGRLHLLRGMCLNLLGGEEIVMGSKEMKE